MKVIFLLAPTFLSHTAYSLPSFLDRIPNGRRVPNPGPQGGVWVGVGHVSASGGGIRNPFGIDFLAAGLEWTEELCRKDSDGDGRSNGEELGDSDCSWTGADDPDGPAVSHPGIVDAVTGESTDACAFYEDPEDVQILNITFSSPNVLDTTRTHYRCQQLTVDSPTPNRNENFMVRSDVILDNPQVLHHIWIYHCNNGDSSDGNRVGEGAYACNGVEANCQIVAGWAVGPHAYCEPSNVAAYLDFSSNVFKIEAHYDNADQLDNVQDQSGMSLRMTPTPRKLDAGLVIIGMDYYDREFAIPPGQSKHPLTNLCPTEATLRGLQHPIWVYSWNPHMHLYGRGLVTEHYRCGKKIGEIGRIDAFEFDNQQSYILNPPVKVLPGDALVTTCTYDSSNVTTTIPGGEETTQEMCDNYLTYYPFAGTNREPNLFTACSSFARGLNPDFVDGYDDTTPFATLDIQADIWVDSWNPDPLQNIAECCASGTCETDHLSTKGSPCGVTADCRQGLVCQEGLCESSNDTVDGDTSSAFIVDPFGGFLLSLLALLFIVIDASL